VVLGGGGGLGEHVVAALGRTGDPVIVADADGAAAARVAAIARDAGADAVAATVDVRDKAAVDALVALADGRGSGLATVVNAFGLPGRVAIEELTEERWSALVDVNLGGVVRVARAAVPVLRARGGGVIVNIASAAALRPSPGSTAYSATKGGVVAFSRSLAAEVAADGIRVWAVCPPAIETGMYVRMLADMDDAARLIAAEAARPLGRVIRPEEIADLVGYLAAGKGPPYGAEPLVI
jgi:3-oxoacyl-[acyl-carrier protein] reductase